MDSGTDDLRHRLWVSVILEIAAYIIEQNRKSNAATIEAKMDPFDDDIDNLKYELVNEWIEDALPAGNDLAFVLGELDYFRDIDLSWEEKVSLSGKPCSYASSVVWDLKDKLECYPDAQEAVTEEVVESFYTFWRTHFLKTVLAAANSVK